MAHVKLAKTAGFCWGVKRAIDITLEAAKNQPGPIYTYGPLIHNPQLIKLLESKNIHIAKDVENMSGGEIIIRTHGITPQKRNLIKAHGLNIKDATCPLVARVQGLIKKFSHQGYSVVIVGDEDHAEVIGLKGYSQTPVHVVSSLDDAKKLPRFEKLFVCAQTTCNIENYGQIVEHLGSINNNMEVGKTICDATTDRQTEVIELAKEVDAMVIVGGKGSANTTRLLTIAREHGIPAWHVESESELDLELLRNFENIGVTAGASTPKWVIDDVVSRLNQLEPSGTMGFMSKILGFAVKSEIFLSFGAIALCYVNLGIMNIPVSAPVLALAFFAILSTYLLNQILRPDEVKRSNFKKYNYHVKYRLIFKAIALLAATGGAIVSFSINPGVFGVYSVLIIFGSTYGVNRPYLEKTIGFFSKIRNIPASKDLLVGLAWAIVTVAIPFMGAGNARYFLFPFFFTFGVGYVRTVLLDLQDIYSDRIVGKEVLPILMGNKRAVSTLYGVLFFELLLVLGMMAGGGPKFGLAYLAGLAYLFGFIYYYHQNAASSTKYNLYLDMHYFVMGIAALILA